MTVQPIQFCPSLQLLQSFFQNIALKGYLTRDRWLSLFQFYRKTLLRNVDPKQPKSVKLSLRSIIETFPRGGASLIRGGAKILRGGAKRSQGSGAPPHTSPQNPAMVGISWSQ
jgi:hypothetical protein